MKISTLFYNSFIYYYWYFFVRLGWPLEVTCCYWFWMLHGFCTVANHCFSAHVQEWSNLVLTSLWCLKIFLTHQHLSPFIEAWNMVFLIHFASYFCTLFLLFSPSSRCLHFLEHGIRERGVSGKGVIGPRDCVGRFWFRVDFIFFIIVSFWLLSMLC